MTKALFINGSPRKNGNTSQLLKRAMDGAREAGAEVELVNLYDRNLNYKGCMSCFACKIKGGKKGVCSFKDDLLPILQKAVEADVLVCGSPNYCGYPSAALRAFMERMEFPAVNYSDYSKPVVLKRICSATIYTMNCPNEEVYRQMNYHVLMDSAAQQLGVFGPTEILYSYDTYQFSNYDCYESDADRELSAAKGGIHALTHALAVSLAGKVRVNSISPGWIDTAYTVYEGPDAIQQPVGRVGNPLDIANMVLYLCSDKAGFITGENICIDGGMTKQMIYHGDCGWTLKQTDK